MTAEMHEIVTPNQLFLVITNDGARKYVFALNEDDLIASVGDIAVAFSQNEIEAIAIEMQGVMNLSAKPNDSGEVELQRRSATTT